MSIELTDSLKNLLRDTVVQLKGSAKRRFMAQTVLELGYGGQSLAEKELGWNRSTIRKGIRELKYFYTSATPKLPVTLLLICYRISGSLKSLALIK